MLALYIILKIFYYLTQNKIHEIISLLNKNIKDELNNIIYIGPDSVNLFDFSTKYSTFA
jgi:hypothetical protein